MLETKKKPSKQAPTKRPSVAPRDLLSTRRGTVFVGVLAAFLAAGAVMLYLDGYRNSLSESARPVTVLVAKELIEKGTSGEVVARTELFRRESVPKGEAKQGAVVDPSALTGKVATQTVYPGQQLTGAAFGKTVEGVRSELSGYERAISVPVDTAHGLVGQVKTGDRVDVLASFQTQREGSSLNRPVVRTLVQSAVVLEAPKADSGGSGGQADKEVVLRVTDKQAQAMAFSADHGKVWITLRPPTRAKQSAIRATSLDALLAGLKPIKLDPKGPGR